jgi:hypothetical protein
MSIKARDLITRSMRRINIVARGEVATAEEAEDGLITLNELLHSWETDGIHIGHTDLTLDSDVELPDSHIRGLRLLLAMELASEYEKPIDGVTIAQADRAKRQLIAEYMVVPDSTFDRSLLDFQANRRRRRYNINEG